MRCTPPNMGGETRCPKNQGFYVASILRHLRKTGSDKGQDYSDLWASLDCTNLKFSGKLSTAKNRSHQHLSRCALGIEVNSLFPTFALEHTHSKRVCDI